MIKKKYIIPEIEVVQLVQRAQLLSNSITDIEDLGLGVDDLIYDDTEENIWNEAW